MSRSSATESSFGLRHVDAVLLGGAAGCRAITVGDVSVHSANYFCWWTVGCGAFVVRS